MYLLKSKSHFIFALLFETFNLLGTATLAQAYICAPVLFRVHTASVAHRIMTEIIIDLRVQNLGVKHPPIQVYKPSPGWW